MKTEVKYVSVLNPTTQEVKAVKIVDDNGNLKYRMLLSMLKDGVVIRDDLAWTALTDMAKAYVDISDSEKLRFRRGEGSTGKSEIKCPREDEDHRQMLDDLKLEQSELH